MCVVMNPKVQLPLPETWRGFGDEWYRIALCGVDMDTLLVPIFALTPLTDKNKIGRRL